MAAKLSPYEALEKENKQLRRENEKLKKELERLHAKRVVIK